MEFEIGFELMLFLYSVIFGIACSIIYDFFRALRIFFKTGKWIVFLQDTLFWIIVTCLTFIFIFVTNSGQVRLHIFLAAGLGSFTYFSTVSKIIMKVFRKVALFLRKCAIMLYNAIIDPIVNIVRKTTKSVRNIARKRKKIDFPKKKSEV